MKPKNNKRGIELFVTCGQFLEPLLVKEIQAMGIDRVREGYRGAHVEVDDFNSVYLINYASRIASRVLVPLVKFKCLDRTTLYDGASTVNWTDYIGKEKTFAIDANVTHRELKNSLFASQVVKDAVCDHFRHRTGARPHIDPQEPDVQLNLFIQNDWAILSFDTSGLPLHKRGYRMETVEAPMQESLAAALLMLAEYRGDEILYDPCCGSGTLLIEAALMATKTAPGYLRKRWGFMEHPQFSQEQWLKVKMDEDAKRQPLKGDISGTDINKNAVRIAKTNLRAAGFHLQVEVIQADFREYTPAKLPNFVICNPPHGKRLDDVEVLKPLYRSLGDFMKRNTEKPAKGFVFTSSQDLAKEVGLAAKRRHVLWSGGIESRLLEFELYDGASSATGEKK
jgi:putative N6-adenine-specific DNA methylase